MLRREQYHPQPLLRNSILRAINYSIPDVITELFQGFHEISKNRMPFNRWNIFHGDNIRQRPLCETTKLVK